MEWNIFADVAAAQKVFRSGVPIYEMPVDSTAGLFLDNVNLNRIFQNSTSLTDDLTLLYHQWTAGGSSIPVLFDAMPVAYIIHPDLCPTMGMHVNVSDDGWTRETSGAPNAQVCMHSDQPKFLDFVMPRLLAC